MSKFDFDFTKYSNTQVSDKQKTRGHFLAVLITFVAFIIIDYTMLPTYNLHDPGSMILFSMILVGFAVLDFMFTFSINIAQKLSVFAAGLMFIFVIVFSFLSSEMLNASEYRDQINIVETQDFNESFEAIALDKIPVVDRASAMLLGDKQMGKVQGLGSQFDINPIYTLCTVEGELYRVSPLEYQDFYKWFQNRNKGIPGYIKVNVNNPNDVEIVMLEEEMIYAPSAYFNNNLQRHIRFQYRDALIADYAFEIDDEGKPFWVVSTYTLDVGFYGAPDADGVIIVDPVTGDSERYSMDEIPEWVDRVQPTHLAWSQIDNWGYYVHGFFNTLFGQKDMLQTTDGYNYVSIDDQLHVFSGLTSVGADRSIVGFSLIDLRTKEASFIRLGGADEYSAMSSAEGQVQHLRYHSTYPIILNMNNVPSYFVSLKDDEGLVKMYAFISVKDYNIVGVGETVAEAQLDYMEKLSLEGATSEDYVDPNLVVVTGAVESIDIATVEGNSNYYIRVEGQSKLFVAPISVSSELPLTRDLNLVEIKYLQTEDATVIISEFDNLDFDFEE